MGLRPTAGTLYPALVLLAVVATGNYFFVDAIAGAVVVGLAAAAARSFARPAAEVGNRRASAAASAGRDALRACGPTPRRASPVGK